MQDEMMMKSLWKQIEEQATKFREDTHEKNATHDDHECETDCDPQTLVQAFVLTTMADLQRVAKTDEKRYDNLQKLADTVAHSAAELINKHGGVSGPELAYIAAIFLTFTSHIAAQHMETDGDADGENMIFCGFLSAVVSICVNAQKRGRRNG
jgi:hypothetical protein